MYFVILFCLKSASQSHSIITFRVDIQFPSKKYESIQINNVILIWKAPKDDNVALM